MHEAAAVLGADKRRRLTNIDIPLARKGVLVGFTFAFAVAMGDFGATSLVARSDYPTLPLVIARMMGRPGAQPFQEAMAASVVLLVVVTLAVVSTTRAERVR